MEMLASEPFSSLLHGIAENPAGRRRLNALTRAGVYASFADGWDAARRANPVGHEDPQEIDVHLRQLAALRASDYAALWWISQIQPRDVRIFDYGGSVGNLFYSYSPVLGSAASIEWTVFDIPNVVEDGRKIAAERGVAASLRFVNSLKDYRAAEILLISGAFHYWEQTAAGFLAQFRERPEHILINRSPVHENQASFITVQGTHTCAFPCRVWNADELIEEFAKEGFRLVDRWAALELSLALPLFPKFSVPSYSGFYFRRADAR